MSKEVTKCHYKWTILPTKFFTIYNSITVADWSIRSTTAAVLRNPRANCTVSMSAWTTLKQLAHNYINNISRIKPDLLSKVCTNIWPTLNLSVWLILHCLWNYNNTWHINRGKFRQVYTRIYTSKSSKLHISNRYILQSLYNFINNTWHIDAPKSSITTHLQQQDLKITTTYTSKQTTVLNRNL